MQQGPGSYSAMHTAGLYDHRLIYTHRFILVHINRDSKTLTSFAVDHIDIVLAESLQLTID